MKRKLHICIVQNAPLIIDDDLLLDEKLPLALISSLKILLGWLTSLNQIEVSIICSSPKEIAQETLLPFLSKFNISFLHVIPHISTYSLKDNVLFTLKAILLLNRIQKKNHIDIIHARYPFSSILSAVFYSNLQLNRIRTVYDIRNPWIETIFEMKRIESNSLFSSFLKKIIYAVEKFSLTYTNGYIFMNDALKDYYLRKFVNFSHKPLLCLNGEFDESKMKISSEKEDQKLEEEHLFDQGTLKIGYIGSMDEWRDLVFIIKMLKEVLVFFPDKKIHLYLIGSGNATDKLIKYRDSLDLKNNVFFLGAKSPDEIKYYYKKLNIGLSQLPISLTATLATPMKILEYLYFDIPTLASRVPCHTRYHTVFEAKGIYLYDFNKESFIQALRAALKDQNNLHTKNLVISKFGRKKMAHSHLKLYKDLLTR